MSDRFGAKCCDHFSCCNPPTLGRGARRQRQITKENEKRLNKVRAAEIESFGPGIPTRKWSDVKIGLERASMKKNVLLHKAKLGKPTPPICDLPDKNFSYGMKCYSDSQLGIPGAMSWKYHTKSVHPKEAMPQRDFIALNKLATKKGAVTAEENRLIRDQYDFNQRPHSSGSVSYLGPIDENQTFGSQARAASTPMFPLIQHQYGQQWVMNQPHINADALKRSKALKIQNGMQQCLDTRSALLRMYRPLVEDPPPWKMSRFSKAQPKVDSWRDSCQRAAAQAWADVNNVARRGETRQGIYEVARQ